MSSDAPYWPPIFDFSSYPPVDHVPRAVPGAMPVILFGITGVVWTIIYIMIIRRGFLDKYPAMPVLAVGSNIAWEFTFAFAFPPKPPEMQIVSVLWFAIDAVILSQVFRYGRKDFPTMSRSSYSWMLTGWLVFTFLFLPISAYEFNDATGGYTTFFVVPFMQFMFVMMLRARRSTAGQTIYIALLKLIGDIPGAIVLFSWYPGRPLFALLFATEIFFDIFYIVLLYRRFRMDGISAWRKI